MYYSNEPENPYIFLFKPAWINEDNEFVDLNIEGILITPEQKIIRIPCPHCYTLCSSQVKVCKKCGNQNFSNLLKILHILHGE